MQEIYDKYQINYIKWRELNEDVIKIVERSDLCVLSVL